MNFSSLQRILTTAIISGVFAGILISLIQFVTTIPLITEAEIYESQPVASAPATDAHTEGHSHAAAAPAAHSHGDEDSWGPEDGLERMTYTVISNVIAGVGFALLLGAAMTMRGRDVDVKSGALWGVSGFLVFSLLPAAGLPPEVPGTVGAPVELRQMWWFLTVACSGVGLAMIVFKSLWIWRGAGVVLLLIPHVIGAPHPEVASGTAPASLAAQFAMMTMITSAIFWVMIGSVSGFVLEKLRAPS